MIADKFNAFYAGLVTFIDRINNIKTTIFKRNRAHIDRCIRTAATQINFTNTGEIIIKSSLREGAALFQLQLANQNFGFKLFVALEHNAVDHLVFTDGDNGLVTGAPNLDIREQTRLQQILFRRFRRLVRHV